MLVAGAIQQDFNPWCWLLCYLATLFQLRRLYNVEWDGKIFMAVTKDFGDDRGIFEVTAAPIILREWGKPRNASVSGR
jgi:hypothetical protein